MRHIFAHVGCCLCRWLAPEVVTQQNYSKAADVYSFGLVLWELLTWQLPWADLGPFQVSCCNAQHVVFQLQWPSDLFLC